MISRTTIYTSFLEAFILLVYMHAHIFLHIYVYYIYSYAILTLLQSCWNNFLRLERLLLELSHHSIRCLFIKLFDWIHRLHNSWRIEVQICMSLVSGHLPRETGIICTLRIMETLPNQMCCQIQQGVLDSWGCLEH